MNIHDFAEGRKLSVRRIMDFTSDVNPIGPSSKAKHAIRKGAKDLIFPPDEKLRHLRQYISRKERIGEENILFGQGSDHILSAMIHALRPTTVAVASPVSKRYRDFLTERNVEIISAPFTGAWDLPIDADSLVKAAKEADMLLLADPHDLTGTTLPAGNLASLIHEMDRQGKTLVIDESYIEFTGAASPVQEVVASKGAMIIRSFSLFYALAGLPMGYGMGPAGLVAEVGSRIMAPQISSLASVAAHASLKDKGYEQRTLRFIEEEKRFILDGLKKVSRLDVFNRPCNFLLLRINGPAPNLKDFFEKRGFMIDEYDDGKGVVYIKLPIKSHKFNARFVKTIKSITER
jgi:histidinol-phosphate/aromatic aminotransferase/cobyric acid decarboxylase-like protein